MTDTYKNVGRGRALKVIMLVFFITFVLSVGRPKRALAADMAEAKGKVTWTSTYGMTIPDSVTLHLLRNGTDTGQTTTATKSGGWAFSFGQQPVRDGSGKAYTYSVKEDTSGLEKGYTVASTEFNADSSIGQKIAFNDLSVTGGPKYEDIVFYYRDASGTLKRSEPIGGLIGGNTYVVPANSFYIHWRTSSSLGEDYGFKIDSITPTGDSSTLTFSDASAIPNYLSIEKKQGTDYPESDHPFHVRKDRLWHYTADSSIVIVITNKGKYLTGGTWGTCQWTISNDRVLTIGAGTGANVGYNNNEYAPWYVFYITSVKTTGKVVLPSDSSYLFYGSGRIQNMDISGFDTRNVKYMNHMFDGCLSLPSLDLSNFDVRNTKDMSYMFYRCRAFTSLNLSNFDTRKVTNMSFMFSTCSSLSSLDLSSFNTESVTNMYGMFHRCSSLKSIKLGAKSGLTDNTGDSSLFRYISPKAKEGEDIAYTGKWTKSSPYNHADSIRGADLQAKYATNSSDFGNFDEATWVWEIEGQDVYGQKYSSDDGITDGKHNIVSLTSDTPAETQIDAFATNKDGDKTGYWTKLDDDTWTYTFYVYKAGVPWRVYEDAISGYTGSYTKENPLAIQSGKDESVITNVSDKVSNQKYGSLKITKILEAGSGTSPAQEFSFEITLTDENKNPLSGNAMFGNTAFSSGKANVSVAAGGSITVSNIPAGYHYSVSEIPARGYRQVSFTNSSGTITDGTTEAVCTNKYVPARETDKPTSETVGLTINKVCDSRADKFKFSINISNLNSDETVAAEIKTTSASASEKATYTPDGSGEINAEAEISGSGSISLSGIPVGAIYRITEAATPYIASYNITDAAGKGFINKPESANSEVQTPLSTMTEMADSGESINITFTNKKPSYPVSFTKRDEEDNFVENAALEVSKADGTKIASWTTAAGESRELSLEPGSYTLKELSAPAGYTKAPDISFTVDDAGKIFIGNMEVSDIEMIDNSIETTVSISKTDNLGFPVTGAGLTLTDTSTGKVADSWQTDNKPHDVKLAFGKTYILSETSVPNGYEKAQNITITVSSDGSLTVDGRKETDTNVSMIDARKPYILPSTGGSGNRRAALLLLSLSSLFALFLLSTKKGKKDSPEGD